MIEINLHLKTTEAIEIWIALAERKRRCEEEINSAPGADDKHALMENLKEVMRLKDMLQEPLLQVPGFAQNNYLL